MHHTDADAIVIGAGFLGACIAHTLAAKNKRVIVVDALSTASAATRLAIGLATPSLHPGHVGETLRGVVQLASLAEQIGVPTRAVRALHLASKPHKNDELRARLPDLAATGLDVKWESSPTVVPNGFGGGLSVAPSFVLDLPALTRKLLDQPAIRVLTDVQVNKIEDFGVRMVLADEYTLSAPSVVLATNAQSGLLSPYLAESAGIARGVVWTSHPLNSGWYGQMRAMPMIVDDGRVIAAEDGEKRLHIASWIWDAEDASDPTDHVRRLLRANAPDLLHETLDWSSGVTMTTRDHAPLAGKLDEHGHVAFAVAAGVYGAAWALVLAGRVADVMAQG